MRGKGGGSPLCKGEGKERGSHHRRRRRNSTGERRKKERDSPFSDGYCKLFSG